MKSSKKSLAERVAEAEQEGYEEGLEMWGNSPTGVLSDLASSAKFKEIVTILHKMPILVAPALIWLQEKQSALATSQLETLYTPEQLQAMAKELK